MKTKSIITWLIIKISNKPIKWFPTSHILFGIIRINNKDSKTENNKDVSKVEKLQNDLKKAIKEEKYEEAAKIRDEIKKIEGKK